MRVSILAAIFISDLVLGADAASPRAPANYARSQAQWRAESEAQLKADDGWLTVVGLTWLKNGESRVGSNPASEVVLPKSAPDRVGTLTLAGGKVIFKPAFFKATQGLAPAVTINAGPGPSGTQPAREMELHPDVDPMYTRVVVGRVKFFIIKREDKFGVRIKDNDSAARRAFTGKKWYPVDPAWRVTAEYVPYDKPRALTFETIAGVKEQDEAPGYVRFTRDGKQYRMDAVVEDNQLWFIMRDATSGKSTYAAARFLYADLPKNGLQQPGPVVLDFNQALNPPCVFTPYATCPLPPPQNRLTLAVTAGEQMYGRQH
jgi:uncharacterized protein (DUF1684 family)